MMKKVNDLGNYKKKPCKSVNYKAYCREEGIRTLDTLPYTRFPSVRLKPLGHLSIFIISNAK